MTTIDPRTFMGPVLVSAVSAANTAADTLVKVSRNPTRVPSDVRKVDSQIP